MADQPIHPVKSQTNPTQMAVGLIVILLLATCIGGILLKVRSSDLGLTVVELRERSKMAFPDSGRTADDGNRVFQDGFPHAYSIGAFAESDADPVEQISAAILTDRGDRAVVLGLQDVAKVVGVLTYQEHEDREAFDRFLGAGATTNVQDDSWSTLVGALGENETRAMLDKIAEEQARTDIKSQRAALEWLIENAMNEGEYVRIEGLRLEIKDVDDKTILVWIRPG